MVSKIKVVLGVQEIPQREGSTAPKTTFAVRVTSRSNTDIVTRLLGSDRLVP